MLNNSIVVLTINLFRNKLRRLLYFNIESCVANTAWYLLRHVLKQNVSVFEWCTYVFKEMSLYCHFKKGSFYSHPLFCSPDPPSLLPWPLLSIQLSGRGHLICISSSDELTALLNRLSVDIVELRKNIKILTLINMFLNDRFRYHWSSSSISWLEILKLRSSINQIIFLSTS